MSVPVKRFHPLELFPRAAAKNVESFRLFRTYSDLHLHEITPCRPAGGPLCRQRNSLNEILMAARVFYLSFARHEPQILRPAQLTDFSCPPEEKQDQKMTTPMLELVISMSFQYHKFVFFVNSISIRPRVSQLRTYCFSSSEEIPVR